MGHAAEEAKRKASHPGSPFGSFTPSLTTGRSHAAAWSSHAHEIRRCGLFMKIPEADTRTWLSPHSPSGIVPQCWLRGVLLHTRLLNCFGCDPRRYNQRSFLSRL